MIFAKLRRQPIPQPTPNPAPSLHVDETVRGEFGEPEKLERIGASMKFQYGSGDTPLDGYKIKRGVGAGGFGEVYFAESDSGKEVALKRIQKNLEVEVRGVRHCLNLRHPNLVAIYDIKFDKLEQGWIVMEFIDGDSLRERMDQFRQGMSTQDASQYFSQLAAGVAYLHDQGIVHRDLKPANVFFDGGLIKIGDYGLSKYISASRRGGQTESVGTFHYMAPEIGKGEYGKEIDIYSLGIILYEMLTGNVPFDGESSQEIILKHLTADPDLTNVPQPYAYVIQRALAKNPVSRFKDCREMLTAIGWDLDQSGLAVRKQDASTLPTPPVIPPVRGNGVFGNGNYGQLNPSTPRAVGGFDETTAGVSPRANSPTANSSSNPWKYRYGVAGDLQGDHFYREPIARAVQQGIMEIQNIYRNLPKGGRSASIAISIILLIINAGIIAPMLMFLFVCYLIYYVFWYMFIGSNLPSRPTGVQRMATMPAPRPTPAANAQTVHYSPAAAVQPVQANQPKPIPYKIALKSWQTEQRGKLKDRGFWTRNHSLLKSGSFSGLVILIIAFAASVLTIARDSETTASSNKDGWSVSEVLSGDLPMSGSATPIVSGIAWTGIMSLATTWVILVMSRRWEQRPEDSIVQRFVLLTIGVGLGVASYGLSQYLMIPWSDISSRQVVMIGSPRMNLSQSWRGFYSSDSAPLLAGHIAYFGSLMWLVRWWRQSDVLRKNRFSLWAIAWSVAMAGLVQGLFYFPGPWCFLFAGVTSFAIQIASPWISYEQTA